VLDAVNRVHGPGMAFPPARRPSYGEHMTHVAGSVVIAGGSAGVVIWRSIVAPRDPDTMITVAIIATIFFAGNAAARWTAAKLSGDGR
jgi:hypothetical protein